MVGEQEPFVVRALNGREEALQQLGIVQIGRLAYDLSEFQSRYEPGHPAADENGYVRYPNVNPLIEAMDMREAQRTYEANLNVVTATRQMLGRTVDILRG